MLNRLLWGYPHLVKIVFSEYADVRRRSLVQRETRQNNTEAAPTDSEKEALLSQVPESSAQLWAHAKVEDVDPEYTKQGQGWYALFNPGLERELEVNLLCTVPHVPHLCVSSNSPTVCSNLLPSSSM